MRIQQVLSIFSCSLLVALLARRSLSCQKAHTQHHHNIHHPHNNVHSNMFNIKANPLPNVDIVPEFGFKGLFQFSIVGVPSVSVPQSFQFIFHCLF
jgi:hypothetical protein